MLVDFAKKNIVRKALAMPDQGERCFCVFVFRCFSGNESATFSSNVLPAHYS